MTYTETTVVEVKKVQDACGLDLAAVVDACANIVAVSAGDQLAARHFAQEFMRRLTPHRPIWQVYQTHRFDLEVNAFPATSDGGASTNWSTQAPIVDDVSA